jgi:Icc-related predicted phosphoesterase
MKVIDFASSPLSEFRFLNAGKGPGAFYEDRLPIHHARVDQLPNGLDAIIVTADLQGRERFQNAHRRPLRLLGEVVPTYLIQEILPQLGMNDPSRVAALLAGDFYTVPALDKRGGTGDVSSVWQKFGEVFAWVAGVAGNHDTFGEKVAQRPRFPRHLHYLDGDTVEMTGLRVAGIGGIIGNPSRHQRRSEESFLCTLELLLQEHADVILMHEGPEGTLAGQPGSSRIRALLEKSQPALVIRGHAHWDNPLIQFDNGLQVLNVDARVVILTE